MYHLEIRQSTLEEMAKLLTVIIALKASVRAIQVFSTLEENKRGCFRAGFCGNKKSKWKKPEEPEEKEVTVTLRRAWLFMTVEWGS